MDPLSIIASSIAVFDGLKEAYRFAQDVIKAGEERKEFNSRLDIVSTVMTSLDNLIQSEKSHPGQNWITLIDPKQNDKSPLKALQLTVEKMVAALKAKKSAWRQRVKDFQWHSENVTLDGYFREMNDYCVGINSILTAATMELSRNNFSLSSETNVIVKTMAIRSKEEREVMRNFQDRTNRLQEEEAKRRDEIERKDIENWLSTFDFPAQRREIFETCAKTGSHFIKSPEFDSWKEGGAQVLRCYGPTGAGKTILSTIVLEHLMQNQPRESTVLCAYFESKTRLTPKLLLGSLLKQLIQRSDSGLPQAVKDAYKKAMRINSKLTQNELKDLLREELNNHEMVFVVIDALDEASPDSRNFVEKTLRSLCPGKIKLMTTKREDEEFSREKVRCNICQEDCEFYLRCASCPKTKVARVDICSECREKGEGCPNNPSHILAAPKIIEKAIITPDDDLKAYVEAIIKDQMPMELDEDDLDSLDRLATKLGRMCSNNDLLFADVVDTVVESAKGRFLIAKLNLRALESKMTSRDVLTALREMKEDKYSLSDLIDKSYDDEMKGRIIEGQEPGQAQIAVRILAIISTARRNLKIKELQQALATREGDNQYIPGGELDRQEILILTKGLVRIDRDANAMVRLDHRTLEEYFGKTRSKHFPDFEIQMAQICLTYLNFNEFSSPCDTVEEFAAKEASHAFISYAVQYWGDHVRGAIALPNGSDVAKAAVCYLQKPSYLSAYIQAAWASSTTEKDKWDVRRTIQPLHVCAWFDLHHLLPLLDHGTELDAREGTYGQTPLMYAVRRGHEAITSCLLDMGASVNLVSGRGRTTLFEAVLSRNDQMVDLLLFPGSERSVVDPNIVNSKGRDRTPLMVAAHMGEKTIVSSILKHSSIQINLQDSAGNTALILAASRGKIDIVKLLLATDCILLNQQEKGFGRTALSWAAEEGHAEVVGLLLQRGADPNIKDMRGCTAIARAAEEGCTEALEKLIDAGAEVTCIDEDGRSPFHLASQNGHIEVI